MLHAIGYCSTRFDPKRPGRLCRGRERWIPGWEDENAPEIWRLVISGARFSDDSARDAVRGLPWSRIDLGLMFKALLPGTHLVAFKEEGELARTPLYVEDEDVFQAPRSGGIRFDACQRWSHPIEDADELARLLSEDLLDGAIALDDLDELDDDLREQMFLLTGLGDSSSFPLVRFQPLAIPQLLERARGVICIHQDKNGPALGIYTLEPLDRNDVICALAHAVGTLAVPFSIPPMLARWDRALHEYRLEWMATRNDEFPVPPAPEGHSPWSASSPRFRAAQQSAKAEE